VTVTQLADDGVTYDPIAIMPLSGTGRPTMA
jgi:hypothetical protein